MELNIWSDIYFSILSSNFDVIISYCRDNQLKKLTILDITPTKSYCPDDITNINCINIISHIVKDLCVLVLTQYMVYGRIEKCGRDIYPENS